MVIVKWSPEDTRKLIKLMKEHEQDFVQPRFWAKKMWADVVRELGLQGKITGKQASKKWQKLVETYEKLQLLKSDSESDNGKDTVAAWQYFEEMHKVLSASPCVRPPVLVASFQGVTTTTRLTGDSFVL
ncbi:uncharacterized protein LOC144043610 isoform X2 [Vanacampus margaritifer]